jgi:hypothetical protein
VGTTTAPAASWGRCLRRPGPSSPATPASWAARGRRTTQRGGAAVVGARRNCRQRLRCRHRDGDERRSVAHGEGRLVAALRRASPPLCLARSGVASHPPARRRASPTRREGPDLSPPRPTARRRPPSTAWPRRAWATSRARPGRSLRERPVDGGVSMDRRPPPPGETCVILNQHGNLTQGRWHGTRFHNDSAACSPSRSIAGWSMMSRLITPPTYHSSHAIGSASGRSGGTTTMPQVSNSGKMGESSKFCARTRWVTSPRR